MIFIAYFFIILSSLLFLASSIFLLRAKDLFVIIQSTQIISFYALPLFLIAIIFFNFDIITITKISIIIICEIIIFILIKNYILQESLSDKVTPDGKIKKLRKKNKRTKN